MALDGLLQNRQVMTAARIADLPATVVCIQCNQQKTLVEMIVVHIKRDQVFRVRPRCKECHNARERGFRREYKRNYLRRWRRANPELNDSYWKGSDHVREKNRVNSAKRLADPQYRDAVAIQRRLRTKNISVSIDEAKELLGKFGRCYPTRFGLTLKGIRECERIRSRLRGRTAKADRRMVNSFDIRLMVYEQSEDEPGLVIPPAEQPVPFQFASERFKRMQAEKANVRADAARLSNVVLDAGSENPTGAEVGPDYFPRELI